MTDCDICSTIERDGWNSTAWFHCHRCHKRWTGLGRAHCNICHETFSTSGVADKHWTKKVGHVPPSEVPKIRFDTERGLWVGVGSYDHSRGNAGIDVGAGDGS